MEKHSIKDTIAHGIHAAHHTEIGKKAIHTALAGTVAVGTAALTPIVGAALAPVITIGALGWGVWRVFSK
jgi:hypothetical protein